MPLSSQADGIVIDMRRIPNRFQLERSEMHAKHFRINNDDDTMLPPPLLGLFEALA
jgi:hypothetical protein